MFRARFGANFHSVFTTVYGSHHSILRLLTKESFFSRVSQFMVMSRAREISEVGPLLALDVSHGVP